MNVSKIILSDLNKIDNVHYYTNFGEIAGLLKLKNDSIIFEPVKFYDNNYSNDHPGND